MEPNSHMYVQQHVRIGYEASLMNGILKGIVNIRDQSRNQVLAQYGSEYATLDTIDLSAASDSVDTALIKHLFPYGVQIALLGCRSTNVKLPDGKIFFPRKFAPMGSALCFPVQTTIFASVVVYASMLYRATRGLREMPDRKLLTKYLSDVGTFIKSNVKINVEESSSYKLLPFAVYGDDIICDTKITHVVISILNFLGFKVNTSKSFVGDKAYRESCGKHYFLGEDVTPLYFTVKRFTTKITPKTYLSLIGMINKLGDYNYRQSHSFLINYLRDHPSFRGKGSPLYFTGDPDDTSGIFSTRESKDLNHHLPCRYNADLQRYEVLRLTVVVKKQLPLPAGGEEYNYGLWMRTAYLRKDKLLSDSKSIPRYTAINSRFRRIWTPAE